MQNEMIQLLREESCRLHSIALVSLIMSTRERKKKKMLTAYQLKWERKVEEEERVPAASEN